MAASVREKLRQLSEARGIPFARILERYVLERLLYTGHGCFRLYTNQIGNHRDCTTVLRSITGSPRGQACEQRNQPSDRPA
jgi:hypothetical protein